MPRLLLVIALVLGLGSIASAQPKPVVKARPRVALVELQIQNPPMSFRERQQLADLALETIEQLRLAAKSKTSPYAPAARSTDSLAKLMSDARCRDDRWSCMAGVAKNLGAEHLLWGYLSPDPDGVQITLKLLVQNVRQARVHVEVLDADLVRGVGLARWVEETYAKLVTNVGLIAPSLVTPSTSLPPPARPRVVPAPSTPAPTAPTPYVPPSADPFGSPHGYRAPKPSSTAKSKIAVMGVSVTVKDKLTVDIATRFGNQLRARPMDRDSIYDPVHVSDREVRALRSRCATLQPSCVAAFGAGLRVQWILVGTIEAVGSDFHVTVRLVDVASKKTARIASAKLRDGRDDLEAASRALYRELVATPAKPYRNSLLEL